MQKQYGLLCPPSDFFGYYAAIWSVNGSGGSIDRDNVIAGGALRPYISIKSSTMVSSGSGTSDDPYIIK